MFRKSLLGSTSQPVRSSATIDNKPWRGVSLLESLQGARLVGTRIGRGSLDHGEHQRRYHNRSMSGNLARHIRQLAGATAQRGRRHEMEGRSVVARLLLVHIGRLVGQRL